MATPDVPQELPKRLPLVVEPENRDDSVLKDGRLINCFVETKKKQEGAETWIYQRPGLTSHSQPSGGAAAGRGMFNWRDNVYSIFGNVLYKDGVAQAGTVDTTAGVYRFDSCLGATPKMQLGNGVKAYNFDTAGGLVLISDVDFPTSFVKGWAYLNGVTYVGRTADGGIQGSDTNDPVNWNALNVLIAQIEPDRNKAINKQLVYVVDMKEWTTEVFYDAGNSSGTPLGRVEGAKSNYGCAHADSVQNIDGMLLWLSANKSAALQVVRMDGLKIDVVSTKAIERLLEGANLTTVFSWQLKIAGHRFYVITLKNEDLTLAYDLAENRWCQWTDSTGAYFPIVASCYNSSQQALLQHESDGRIYTASMATATDNSALIQVDIYTPNFDGGTKRRKVMSMLEMVADQQVGSILQVRFNDHDYNPTKWTNFRRLDMSQKRPLIENCGTFVRRATNFRHKCPIRMPRIQAVDLQMMLGEL